MGKMTLRQQEATSQSGMVSIMVTMILMIVLTLIVIGFAQIARRNSRQSLDRQLSTSAFYAAESGVNDIYNLIKTSGAPPAKADCTNGSGAEASYYGNLPSATLDAAANVKYTCITVDPTSASLVYDDIASTSTIVPIKSADGSAITSLTLTWQSKTGSTTPINNCPNSTTKPFSTYANWQCGYGVLRFDMVPTVGGGLTANSLRTSTMTSFVLPMSSGGAVGPISFSAGVGNANNLYGLTCNNTNCSLTIGGAAGGLGQNFYYMRLSTIYKDVSLQISATNSAGAVQLAGAQIVVDATGKAQDVLRRIQVRIPQTTSQSALPDNAMQSSEAVCKRFAVANSYFLNLANISGTNNSLCKP